MYNSPAEKNTNHTKQLQIYQQCLLSTLYPIMLHCSTINTFTTHIHGILRERGVQKREVYGDAELGKADVITATQHAGVLNLQ